MPILSFSLPSRPRVLTNLPINKPQLSRDILQPGLCHEVVGHNVWIHLPRKASSARCKFASGHVGEGHGLISPVGGELLPRGVLGRLQDRLRRELVVESDESAWVVILAMVSVRGKDPCVIDLLAHGSFIRKEAPL